MLSEKIFAIAKYADQVVLFILVAMSIISIAVILERFLALSKISGRSADVQRKIKSYLINNNPAGFKEIANETDAVEGRAASFSLKHIEKHGENGFEEFFSCGCHLFLSFLLNLLECCEEIVRDLFLVLRLGGDLHMLVLKPENRVDCSLYCGF